MVYPVLTKILWITNGMFIHSYICNCIKNSARLGRRRRRPQPCCARKGGRGGSGRARAGGAGGSPLAVQQGPGAASGRSARAALCPRGRPAAAAACVLLPARVALAVPRKLATRALRSLAPLRSSRRVSAEDLCAQLARRLCGSTPRSPDSRRFYI